MSNGMPDNPLTVAASASPSSPLSPSSPRSPELADRLWSSLAAHFNQWFHCPDLGALRVFMCAVAAHDISATEPIWPVVVGPPSTGKTEICLRPFLSLRPNFFPQSDITPKAFLSGTGGKSGSLLHRTGTSGVWLFKDFGTIMSKREQDLKEVLAFLREIFDGELSREVGGKQVKHWEGKITVLAAATEEIERARLVMSALGERFVMVRWSRGDSMARSQKARNQIGHERSIRVKSQQLVREFLEGAITRLPAPPPPALAYRIDCLAEITAWLRAHVIRDRSDGKSTIIDIPEWEGAARLSKTMSNLVSFHAALFGRPEPTDEDMAPAVRVAFDSIRPNRVRFISAIPIGAYQTQVELSRLSAIPEGSLDWVSKDLLALGIVEKTIAAEVSFRLTTAFERLLQGTGIRQNAP